MLVYEVYARDSRVRRHARALAGAGYAVEVGALVDEQSIEAAARDGVALASLRAHKYRGASRAAYLLAYLAFTARAWLWITRRVLGRRADLVYVNNPPDFLVFAAVAARMRGIPLLLDIHDLTSDLYVAKFGAPGSAPGGGGPAASVVRRIERWSVRFADALLTIHDRYAARLAAVARPGVPVVGVWNVPDADAWLPIGDGRADEPAGDPPSAERPLRLGHHGTIVERFGIDQAVDVVAALRGRDVPVTLSILGDGDFADALGARIAASGVADSIQFERRIFTHDDLVAFTAQIDLGVAPYRPSAFSEEGLPTKVLEYLALGVPVISTETALLREHLGDAVRLVSGTSVPELADAIAEMADPQVRAAYRRAGRAAAHQMGWPGQREKLLNLVGLLLSR
jgi:glycosyltransferase involved in cell wall biosynthesis